MVRTFWTVQYRTSPDEKPYSMNRKIKGRNRNILACICCISSAPGGIGVIRIWKNIVSPISIGSMLKNSPSNGIFTPQWRRRSGCDRSVTQRKSAWRNSAADRSMKNRPRKIGIWIRMGRHPAAGLTLFSLKSFWTSCCIFCGLSLYLAWISFIGAEIFCIRFWDSEALAVSGQKRSLMMMVINMIAHPQLLTNPYSACISISNSLLNSPKKPNCMTKSWCFSFWPSALFTWLSLFNSFGPAYRVSLCFTSSPGLSSSAFRPSCPKTPYSGSPRWFILPRSKTLPLTRPLVGVSGAKVMAKNWLRTAAQCIPPAFSTNSPPSFCILCNLKIGGLRRPVHPRWSA